VLEILCLVRKASRCVYFCLRRGAFSHGAIFHREREDVRPVANARDPMIRIYWKQLRAEFGINLNRFGGRGSASLESDARILIRLAAGQWQIERTSPTGSKKDWNHCALAWP
jgi:hypothetical protein